MHGAGADGARLDVASEIGLSIRLGGHMSNRCANVWPVQRLGAVGLHHTCSAQVQEGQRFPTPQIRTVLAALAIEGLSTGRIADLRRTAW